MLMDVIVQLPIHQSLRVIALKLNFRWKLQLCLFIFYGPLTNNIFHTNL
jgi:hypothetical protein